MQVNYQIIFQYFLITLMLKNCHLYKIPLFDKKISEFMFEEHEV